MSDSSGSDGRPTELATFGAGCFWQVEDEFRRLDGVIDTAVGYEGGHVDNPTYEQVCSGTTGHVEVCEVEFDPARVGFETLVDKYFEIHDPTQLNRQAPDVGYQYRSVIFAHSDAQRQAAEASRDMYQAELTKAGYGEITTEIADAPAYYFAEDYHQQYLAKNPNGYCPDHSTGVACPIGLGVRSAVSPMESV